MLMVGKVRKLFLQLIDKRRLARSRIVLNKVDRALADRRVVFNLKMKTSGDGYILTGKLRTDENWTEKAAIVAINMFDENNKKVTLDPQLRGFSNSKKYGNYQYLPGSAKGTEFQIMVPCPSGTARLKIEIHGKSGVKAFLHAGANVERVAIEPMSELQSVIAALEQHIQISGGRVTSDFDVDELFEKKILSGKSASKIFVTTKVLEYYNSIKHPIAPIIGWAAYRMMHNADLAEEVRRALVESGSLYQLKKLIDELNLAPPNGWKHDSRRVASDIELLECGFSMPAGEYAQQEGSREVFYLLHNSLPYNSGGYATRTHGLLTGVKNIGRFTPVGFSRPGYPSDHKKHISRKLPTAIPPSDIVDEIEYLRSSQDVRKSRLTLAEYVEAFARDLVEEGRARRVSLVHAASNYPNGLAAALAGRRLGVPSIYEVRGLWEVTRMSRQKGWEHTDHFKFMARMEAEACNHVDRVITITDALKDLLISRGVDGAKITVAPNCVHTDLFSPDVIRSERLSIKLGIQPNDVVIGYVGSVVNYEGLFDLLRAAKLIIDKNYSDFKILIVGDGAVLDDLIQASLDLNLSKHVIFTGRVPHSEVQEYYSLIDITPFPREPFLVCDVVSPLKPFEALACGKAVLVSSCAALTEIIEDGVNGLVFTKGDVVDLADKLLILIKDGNFRKQLGLRGRDWVVRNRDWKHSAKIVSSLYESLLP